MNCFKGSPNSSLFICGTQVLLCGPVSRGDLCHLWGSRGDGLRALFFSRQIGHGRHHVFPIVIPDIAMAIMLLLFFNFSGIGFNVWKLTLFGVTLAVPYSVIIGHVAFDVAFVAVVVRARLAQMDRRLEEAAEDLYANAWQTFRRVTLPQMMPGILGGALLAFTLSLDDFVITFFTSGAGFNTLPVRVFSMIKKGVTPKINAVSTLMLGVSLLLVSLSQFLQRSGDDGQKIDMF